MQPAMLRALFPDAVYIPKQKYVHAPVKFHSRTIHSDVNALIDSGATENFISPELVEHFWIPTLDVKPRVIRNVDGTSNQMGKVIKAVILYVKYKGQRTAHTFYVITLGDDHMLLGMPFLAATNPDIDWTNGEFIGQIHVGTTDAHEWKPEKGSKEEGPFEPDEDIDEIEGRRAYYRTDKRDEDDTLKFTTVEPEDYMFIRKVELESHASSQHRGLEVALQAMQKDLTLASYPYTDRDPEAVYKELRLASWPYANIKRTTTATQIAAEAADKTIHSWRKTVPKEYHHYGVVFSETKAQHFPARRSWDHAINLKPDAPEMLDSKCYPLPVGQQEALDKFLKEHLKKGYIRVSKSPYAAPFFFVKKKDGKLRPVQDY